MRLTIARARCRVHYHRSTRRRLICPQDDSLCRDEGDVDLTDTPTAQPWSNQRAIDRAMRASKARTGRRRMVDPTICERDYTEAELEFMLAVENYKRTSGRMFPTWSELSKC